MIAVEDEGDIADLDVITIVALVLSTTLLGKKRKRPVRQHVSVLTGQHYYDETMQNPNRNNFRVIARMDKDTFLKLLDLLVEDGGLKPSPSICEGQKLMIFISALTGISNRVTAERWQHSGSTISLIVHEVAECFSNCKEILFVKPKPGDPVQPEILNNPLRFPFFANCIGALDGTQIPAIVPAEEQELFRNRKKVISQNVLGVCNFDLTFSYVLTGWEGSAHDGKVLADARTKGLFLFPGKYFLGDAGYALSWICLTPYRGVRYT